MTTRWILAMVAIAGGCGVLTVPSTEGLPCDRRADCDEGQLCRNGECLDFVSGCEVRVDGLTCVLPSTLTPGGFPCSPIAQDCGPGLKCVPFDVDEDLTSDTTQCVPVTGSGRPGDACEFDGFGGDTCNADSICFRGYCMETCGCSYETPTCSGNQLCAIVANDTTPVCVSACNPLDASQCPDDFRCIPDAGTPAFVCWRFFEAAGLGDECGYSGVCPPESACLDGTCTALCSADGRLGCPSGETCVSFSVGVTEASECYRDLGFCF